MSFAERYGPWAVITGASEGTGREFALQIAEEGVPSVLIARRPEPLAALAREIKINTGLDCVTACIDLAALDACEQVVAAVGDREIGLFISNAGADPNGANFLDKDIQAWADLVQRNVMTVLKCTHHFAGPMAERGSGGIILVNSGACYGGLSGLGPYCGSKAFNLCLAEALWAELAPKGVDVLTLVMGQTDTPEYRRLLAEQGKTMPAHAASPAAVARAGLERLPHGPIHNWGEADDQAGMTSLSAAQRRERVLAIAKMTAQASGRS